MVVLAVSLHALLTFSITKAVYSSSGAPYVRATDSWSIDRSGLPHEPHHHSQPKHTSSCPHAAAPHTVFPHTSFPKKGPYKDTDHDALPNFTDPDIDNDGISNGFDKNVDGGAAYLLPGHLVGGVVGELLDKLLDALSWQVGDPFPNGDPRELDIDGDGLADGSPFEWDIDGDGFKDDAPCEQDIDGDGVPDELDGDVDGDSVDNFSDSDMDGDATLNLFDSSPDGVSHPATWHHHPWARVVRDSRLGLQKALRMTLHTWWEMAKTTVLSALD